MTKAEEILEKHLENNPDQRIYLKGSKLTYNLCIDAINEAINYTPCCEMLKDEDVLTFKEWLKKWGWSQVGNSAVFKRKGTYTDTESLIISYKKEYSL